MSFANISNARALAVATALGLLVSGCGGGGGGGAASSSAPGVLPQTAARGTAERAPGGIRSGMVRIEKSDASPTANARIVQTHVGSSQPATAVPPVPRPDERPCIVQLFSHFQFTNFTYPTFQYTPPSACPGPWAKVVLDADFNVTAGRQFDRTASIWIAGTNVYFGTTAEPSATVSPSWHVERDVTALSAIFRSPSTGEVVLGNIVNSTYTGIISASSKLEFYPAGRRYPARVVADDVYPLSGGPLGDNQYISTQQQPLTATYTLPRNIRAAYLDVYLQSQIGDEFWYTCFPSDLAAKIPNCGNTAFREGDVAVDGQPAGISPVYPWIYTGGIDPYLWRPIPGVETFDFTPYRVNLTPFAGILSDGRPHTITVNVFNNGNYFAANAALLTFLDHGSSQVTGGIIRNTTSLYPSPSVTENVRFNAQGLGAGPVSVTSTHPLYIAGYVNTSRGRIETQVRQRVTFSNMQQISANTTGTIFDQNIKQQTNVLSDTTTLGPGFRRYVREEQHWPLQLIYDYNVAADGSAVQKASVEQGKIDIRVAGGDNDENDDRGETEGGGFRSFLSNFVQSSDTLTFPTTGGYTPSGGESRQIYIKGNNRGYCYAKTVISKNYVLTGQFGGSCFGL